MASFEPPKETGRDARQAQQARPWSGWVVVLLAVAALAAYHNSFSAPFVFDDFPAIVDNPAFPALRAANPNEKITGLAAGTGLAGRPVVQASLALNYAWGGADVRGYHLFNVLVHIAAGLLLFGVVRRVLWRCASPDWIAREADALAFLTALLWLVHPLQTESVTCVIQRTESLAGLFFLLTLYGFVRGAEGARGWLVAGWVTCAVGAATKEMMVVAPVVVLLLDRALFAGSLAEAWRRRGPWYAALTTTTWIVVGWSIWSSGVRGGAVGFGHGVTSWDYLLTQARAVMLYLKLAVWPHPLVLDYGTGVVHSLREVWPQSLAVLALIGATGWGLWRGSILGFCGAWFFAILAPSSSFVPLVTQTMAEHRMYLPLAAVVLLAVLALRAAAGRAAFAIGGLLALALGVVTVHRNADYHSVETLWRDNLVHYPASLRPLHTLASLADAAGRTDEAIADETTIVRAEPSDLGGRYNLAVYLSHAGRHEEAVESYREALKLNPRFIDAYVNLGAVLVRLGRFTEAAACGEEAVRLSPDSPMERFNLAQVYFQLQRWPDALVQYQASAKLDPSSALTHYRLGHVYVRLNRFADAAGAFRETLRLQPDHFEARLNLASTFLSLGRAAEAIPIYEEAVRLKPEDPTARANLAYARQQAAR